MSINYMDDFDFSKLSNFRPNGSTLPSPDQYVGELEVTKEDIKFIFHERDSLEYEKDSFSYISNCTYREYNVLVILESPHRFEYGNNGIPLGLAMGKTGENFFSLFASTLKKSQMKLVERKYNVILSNAVQYQTSCGLNPIDRELRDKNWKDIYFNYGGEEDLRKRIFAIKPRYTINLCTGGRNPEGLRQIVNRSLISFGLKQGKHFTDGNHPAAWVYNGNIGGAIII